MKVLMRSLFEKINGLFFDVKFLVGSALGLTLGFIFTCNLIDYYKSVTSAANIFEPYIYLASDKRGFLSIFIGGLIIISDAPFIKENANYEVLRIGKKRWLQSRIIYMFSACVVYMLIIITGISIFTAFRWHVYKGNLWSPGMTFLTIQKPDFAMIKYKVSFPFGGMISSVTPYTAMFLSLLYNTMYLYAIGLIIFIVNTLSERNIGWIIGGAFHIVSYVLYMGSSFNFYIVFSPMLWAMPANYFEGTSIITATIVIFSVIYGLIDISVSSVKRLDL